MPFLIESTSRFLEPCWLRMTSPWSHLGPRWPRGSSFYRFLTDLGAPKILQKSIQKSRNFQTSIETLFSVHGAHKRSKMKVQNNSQIKFFSAQGQNPKIVLSPRRGLSLRGLKQSKITSFFRTICVSPGHAALVPLFFEIYRDFGEKWEPRDRGKKNEKPGPKLVPPWWAL